ncbi:hypothetical protein KI387_022088, partial [Taxus chinensis]
VMFSWLDDEASTDVVAGNNHGERGVIANKSFDDQVCLGLAGRPDTWDDSFDTHMTVCRGEKGIGHVKEDVG